MVDNLNEDAQTRNNDTYNTWVLFRAGIPTHLKSFVEKLSWSHSSGIRLEQLDSPMMKQFKSAKEEVPDALLFFRMGDFFELFGLDAIIVSDICNLTLTSRDKSHPNPVPMAGVPVVTYKNTLKKCLEAGFKVAVCDQVEDPRLTKGIVKREITRIATPAMPGDLEDDDENVKKNIFGCYLASIICFKNNFTFSYIDVSTGEFRLTSELNESELKHEILTIKPKEILIDGHYQKIFESLLQLSNTSNFHDRILLNKIEPWLVKSQKICKDIFLEFFDEKDFHKFGLSTISGSLTCVAALLLYLKQTQKNILKNIRSISYYKTSDYLLVDESTKKNLELFLTSTGEKKRSLFHFLNQCATAMGSRMLFRRMNYPLKYVEMIQSELNHVEELFQNKILCTEIQNFLLNVCDIEKILSRAAQKNLDVKSAALLKNSLNVIPKLLNFIDTYKNLIPLFNSSAKKHSIENIFPLVDILNSTLVDNDTSQIGSGPCIFVKGYSKELDEIYDLQQNFNQKLDELEHFERTRSCIPTLKIGYTRVFGYYFEISRGKLAHTPKHFERKQTLTNAERFITPELKELESKTLSAAERRFTLEKELFESLRLKILEFSNPILETASFLAHVDLISNFAELAHKYGWVKPALLAAPETKLVDCYHPIMKHLTFTDEEFIPNTVELNSEHRIHLITGPNMAGKSTLMRQVALNQLLCHMGSFVCAKSAHMGVVDRILSRIGSADHGLKNQSTFMVEMLETAHILKLATHQSLLLMDEVGRGTSTYDGLSIAWAVLEDIHDNHCPRTLFSTHYHELVKICEEKQKVKAMQMGVLIQTRKNAQNDREEYLIFSRKYTVGFIGQSFGLNVALIAGIHPRIIARAKEILKDLEQGKNFVHTKNHEMMNRPKKSIKIIEGSFTLF